MNKEEQKKLLIDIMEADARDGLYNPLPKEKAEELVNRYDSIDVLGEEHNGYIACQCALVAVDEILKAGKDVDEFADAYWQQVKQEIEKL